MSVCLSPVFHFDQKVFDHKNIYFAFYNLSLHLVHYSRGGADWVSLGGVGGGGHVAPRAGPVGVHELAGRRQQLVRVRAEVIALRLD